jgi:hypothetical protein
VAIPARWEAPAPAPAEDAEPTDGADHRESMWRIELGYRGSYVPDAGLDPFSKNDYLPQFSATASRTLLSGGHMSFAPGLAFDIGGTNATARGDNASLTFQRFTVPLEGRLHLGALGYVFVRGAPGFVAQHAEVKDASAPAALEKTRALFAFDLSGGVAWLVGPKARGPRAARVWLQADGGYGWVAAERLDLHPALASGDERIVSGTDLGTINLSGGFFRIAAAVSF